MLCVHSKPLALWSSLFFVINWILGCALAPKPFTLGDNVFYFAVRSPHTRTTYSEVHVLTSINPLTATATAIHTIIFFSGFIYIQIAPVLTLPIPFFVIFDFARDRAYLYHVFVCISTWSWSVYQVIFMCVLSIMSRLCFLFLVSHLARFEIPLP